MKEDFNSSQTTNSKNDVEPLSYYKMSLCKSNNETSKSYFGIILFEYIEIDNTKWEKEPLPQYNTKLNNIIYLPEPKLIASSTSPLSCFNVVMQPLLEEINCYNHFDPTEFNAFIGLLIMAGMYKSNHQNIKDLFDPLFGIQAFSLTMPLTRFSKILRTIKFDDPITRRERYKYDKATIIRKLLDIFNSNSLKYFSPGQFLTLDKILLLFKGRCSFKEQQQQCLPKKPNKYGGLKFNSIVDSNTSYTLQMELYVDRQPKGIYDISNEPSDIVKRLVLPFTNSHRNVTMDKRYTSFELANELYEKNGLTMVGTIGNISNKNKEKIPDNFKFTKNRSEFSSIYGYRNNMTLVSYIPKKGKITLALSTMPHMPPADKTLLQSSVVSDDDRSSSQKNKPEILVFYEMTKAGIDTIKKQSYYSISRTARRWSICIFYHLINVSLINAKVLHDFSSGCYSNNNNSNTAKTNNNKKMKRIQFLRSLVWQLIAPQMKFRMYLDNIPRHIRLKLQSIFKSTKEEEPSSLPLPIENLAPKRCEECPRARDVKSKTICSECKIYICKQHRVIRCVRC